MGMSYWPIVGYGMNYEDLWDNIDGEKFDEYIEDALDLFEESYRDEVIACLIDKAQKNDMVGVEYIDYSNDGDETSWILYHARYPWQMKEEEKEMTDRDIQNIILGIITPVLKDTVDPESLRQHFKEVSTYGCG